VTTLLVALLLASGPTSIDARYRIELGGEVVGFARLVLACQASACQGSWESGLRAPIEAGGGIQARHIDFEVDGDKMAREVRVQAEADGRVRRARSGRGPVPASLAELLLSTAQDGQERCLRVRDEESGAEGQACARRRGAWLSGAVLGEPIRFRAAPGEAPAEVVLPAQKTRFVADAAADLPARPPRLFGGVAATTERWPSHMCGVEVDRESPPAPSWVPRFSPGGASCRDSTARYLRVVARRGVEGRHAVGVAFDGERFVWHEWAEVRAGGAWVPVDPSFGQWPAAGPRFTLGHYEDGDLAGRALAGRRILACWARGTNL